MRDIKFRVWDKNEKEMYSNAQNTYDYACTSDNHIPAERFADLIEDEKWELMQFTGLHDKKGKEIYEGDILSVSNYRKKYGIVRWNEKVCGFYIYKAPSTTLKYADIYEVIGNIYENPDLLKGADNIE